MASGPQRLQKLLAAAGLGSRRTVERWIAAGRVTVNGKTARLGDQAAPGDEVRLDGKLLSLAPPEAERHRVLIYHKPIGEVTTRSDPQHRPTVFTALPEPESGRWISVGRLDADTSGLLLFTTDGALANRLMHPSHEVEREYLAVVSGRPAKDALERLLAGVQLDDGPARFDSLKVERAAARSTSVRVALHEGRNREVRRLWAAVGHPVVRLTRTRYGPVKLPRDLPAGAWRYLSQPMVDRLGSIGQQ